MMIIIIIIMIIIIIIITIEAHKKFKWNAFLIVQYKRERSFSRKILFFK